MRMTPPGGQYIGRRYPTHCSVVFKNSVGDEFPLDPRLDLRDHSPTGFEWGYAGSGPAQLALALLAEAINDKYALAMYQEFKEEVVVGLPANYWEVPWLRVNEWVKLHPMEETDDGGKESGRPAIPGGSGGQGPEGSLPSA